MKNLHPLDLLVVSITAIISALVVLAGIPVLKVVAGLLLVLVLPGYAFFSAVFPRRPTASAEGLLVIAGSSIVLTALGGLALYMAGPKLAANSLALLLTGVVLLSCLVAYLRRKNQYLPLTWPPVIRRFNWLSAGLVFLAVVLVVAGIGLASSPITNTSNLQGYTVLWILPGPQGSPGTIRLGINSDEFTTTSYTLQLDVNGQVVNTWQNLTLAPGKTWEITYQAPAGLPAGAAVQAFLYKTGTTSIYRQVKLLAGG